MKPEEKYLIGVDGGGTTTVAVLADSRERILKKKETGPSSFVKVGMKKAVSNIIQSIKGVLNNKEIKSTFIALAAVEENKEVKKEIRKLLFKSKKIKSIFEGRVVIGSDQEAGFRSGTREKEGLVLISGTGTAAHGWKKGKEYHVSGWGWIADEGSAFWIGQKSFQAVLKEIDGRGEKTLMTNLFFKKFGTKKPGLIKKKVYLLGNVIKNVSQLSVLTDRASRKGDELAKKILKGAANELSLSANTVIRELKLKEQDFPLVLIGGVFKSQLLLRTVQRRIKRTAPQVEFIRPRQDPVIGAVRLAAEELL